MFFLPIIYLIVFVQSLSAFPFSINNDPIFMDCARSIIIKNHFWYLTELFHLIQSLPYDENSSFDQSIPFEYLHSIFQSIFLHCQQAHRLYHSENNHHPYQQIFQWVERFAKI